MKKIISILILILFGFSTLKSQNGELRCSVQVITTQISMSDIKRIGDNLAKQVTEFMNQKWTNDTYSPNERIDCNIQINLVEQISISQYKATILINSERPVFKTAYNSPLFNYLDQNFLINYVEFQQFNFDMTTHNSNLTSVLAYYAYLIIGYDADTFSPSGGTTFFQRAQTIVSNAQSASETGWKAFESNKNRYWLVENTLAPVFAPMRESFYKYHRLGLDIMAEKTDAGRAIVLEALQNLLIIHKSRPASYNMELFFNAKTDEVINIFKKAIPNEKTKIIELLNSIDPSNTNKYNKIIE